MEGQGRSTPRLIADAFGLYRRYPLLFLALAAMVIVPFELLELALTASRGSGRSTALVVIGLVFGLGYWVVLSPLVSALHIHAVSDIRAGEEPRLLPIAKRGLTALPVVSAATIMSFLGIFVGFTLFFLPGIFLWVRWLVVAQAAALEREGWIAALKRSWALSEGSWIHVFVFFVLTSLILLAPLVLFALALHGDPAGVRILVETPLQILVVSFTALATALLYYDLRARRGALAAEWHETGESDPRAAPADHSLDPRDYSDEERPNGWYVDPQSPHRMRYWLGGEQPGWRGKARTPGKVREQFDEEEATRIAGRLGPG